MNISFEAFFNAVEGHAPYPWQAELSRQVREEGWPEVLDIPTGAGKTAALDIALHHLAVDAGQLAPRRIIMVVDRRVIVDQVGRRARKLLRALENAEEADSPEHRAALTGMRDALQQIVGPGSPLLQTDVLRGATVRHDAWARYPHVPVLAGSTVDQVGSRLFFRGYGLSDRMQPIHAGLLGCDTLLLLDEVHLSRPFAEVLEQLGRLRGREEKSEVPRRFQVVQLSATPGKSMIFGPAAPQRENGDGDRGGSSAEGEGRRARTVFRLDEEDRVHGRLAPILQASKPALLDLVKAGVRSSEEVKRQAIADAAAAHVREMLAEGRNAVAVVVNRVDTARRVWTLLQGGAYDTVLITGRMRPLDQAESISRIESRVAPGRARNTGVRPLVVVATQTIEAGADYDFDGLVTECASLDALRQRFGRLDRMGKYRQRADEAAVGEAKDGDAATDHHDSAEGATAATKAAARAVILMRSDYLGSVVDPVYHGALSETWKWLVEIGEDGAVDFGIGAMEPKLAALGDEIDTMLAPHRDTPVLLPAYLDQWAQTNPKPHADPDVSLFLHGIPKDARDVLPDVRVVWRADITAADLAAPTPAPGLLDHLAMLPPGSLEALSLPVWAVKRWLSSAEPDPQDDDIADLEGVAGPRDDAEGGALRVLVWRGTKSESASVREVKPGATIVVPATYGGIGVHGTFDPAAPALTDEAGSTRPIYDLGDLVQLRQRGSPTLRLDPRVLRPFTEGERIKALLPDAQDEEIDVRPALRDALRTLRELALPDAPTWFEELLDGVEGNTRFVPSPRRVLDTWFAFGRPGAAAAATHTATLLHTPSDRMPAGDADISGNGEEDELESFTGKPEPPPLDAHLVGVGEMAGRFARRLKLPLPIVASLEWAGRLHDAGKADPSFQLWLRAGDEVEAKYGDPLAKSALPWQDAAARRDARKRARYPAGQRHELVSLDMIEQSEALQARVGAGGADWDLVLHLVATHHGWCRPLAPVLELSPDGGQIVEFAVDGVALEGNTDHRRDCLGAGVAARFWRLNRRYGRHELAYLEAIVRLADHRQSATETEQ